MLTDEPRGFWAARQLGVWMQRGNPHIGADDVSAGDLDRSELVLVELDEGERRHQDHIQKVHEDGTRAVSAMVPMLDPGSRPPWAS